MISDPLADTSLADTSLADTSLADTSLADTSLADTSLAVLRERLRGGVRASPLCLAVMGWLADVPRDPHVVEAKLCADGRVWLRLSDERALEPYCSLLDFLDQVRTVCVSVALDEAQTAWVVTRARRRLG